MSNYCAYRDHGPGCILQTVVGSDPFTHARFHFLFRLPGQRVLLLESIKRTGSIRIPKAFGFFPRPSWFILHSSKRQATPCSSGPVSAGAYHKRSDKARVQRFRTGAPLSTPTHPPTPGNTNFKRCWGRKPQAAKFYWPALTRNRVFLHGTDETQSSLQVLPSGLLPPRAAGTLAPADAGSKDRKYWYRKNWDTNPKFRFESCDIILSCEGEPDRIGRIPEGKSQSDQVINTH